ncbi:MAG: DUF1015 domain-containing protein [Spirochaetaceae bacterium]
MELDQRLSRLGLRRPDILLPRQGIDLKRWAVIACDQHTSNPGYWEALDEEIGEAPSTLRLVFPEAYLEERSVAAEAEAIGKRVRSYLEQGVFQEHPDTPVLVLRRSEDGALRPGILFALDLEQYEYTPGATTLVRASELTIESRLPPRVEIRERSPLELPHILVLIDDASSAVIEPLAERLPRESAPLYETDLLAGGGSVSGYPVGSEALEESFLPALEKLAEKRRSFLYAAGDGNHSLAAAKEVWERRKRAGASMDHRSRWALVELVNLYTPGLRFEPIHRLLTGEGIEEVSRAIANVAETVWSIDSGLTALSERERRAADQLRREVLMLGATGGTGFTLSESDILPIGVVDDAISDASVAVDYVHGEEEVLRLAEERDGAAIILPPIDRGLLFPTVAQRGVLPRKAFSLGHAEEKRYYMEARRIE